MALDNDSVEFVSSLRRDKVIRIPDDIIKKRGLKTGYAIKFKILDVVPQGKE